MTFTYETFGIIEAKDELDLLSKLNITHETVKDGNWIVFTNVTSGVQTIISNVVHLSHLKDAVMNKEMSK